MACDALPLGELPSLPTPQGKTKAPTAAGMARQYGSLAARASPPPTPLEQGQFSTFGFQACHQPYLQPRAPAAVGTDPGDPELSRRLPQLEQGATQAHTCQEMVGREAGFSLSNAAAMAGGQRAQEHRAAGLGVGLPELTSEPQRGARERRRRQKQHRGFLLVWGHGAALEWAVLCS